MATIAGNITLLVTAIANAFNARTRPGASAFEVAVANGYTGTQAQWLAAMKMDPRAADDRRFWFEGTALSVASTTIASKVVTVNFATPANTGIATYGTWRTRPATESLTLTAPNTGDAFFLVVLRVIFNADGTTTSTLVSVPGLTSTNTVQPKRPPFVFPASLVNNPGTQMDLPVAWVWCSSTVVTSWDARVVTSRSGTVIVSHPEVLDALLTVGLLDGGGVYTTAQFSTATGIVYPIEWGLGGYAGTDVHGAMYPIHELLATTSTALTDLLNITLPLRNLGLLDRRTMGLAAGIEYKLMGTTFRAWESDWIDPGANWTIPGSTIYLQYARYRYRSGAVVYESQVTLLGGPVNGDVYIVLPVAIAQPFQNSGVSTGTVTLVNASDNYRTYVGSYDLDTTNNRLYVRAAGVPNNASVPGYHMPVSGNPFGEGWAQSDQIFVHVEYDYF